MLPTIRRTIVLLALVAPLATAAEPIDLGGRLEPFYDD